MKQSRRKAGAGGNGNARQGATGAGRKKARKKTAASPRGRGVKKTRKIAGKPAPAITGDPGQQVRRPTIAVPALGPATTAAGFTAGDLMTHEVLVVHPDTPVEEVSEIFQVHNINGAPVVDSDGYLVGIITEDDLVFGQMGYSDDELEGGAKSEPPTPMKVGEIMTANPIAAEEDTPVEELCRLMWRLKIHRLPIVVEGKVTGIVSAMDICRQVADGKAWLAPTER